MADGPDTTAVYRETRERITAMLEGCSEAEAGRTVPACPVWTVKDVAAHLTGIVADVLAGRIDGVGTDPWTEAQVGARRERGLAEIVAEWRKAAPALESRLGPGGAPAQMIFDEVTHEQDLRGALEQPGARDSAAIGIGLDFVASSFGATLAGHGLGPLRLEADGGQVWTVGEGAPAATLRASSFDLLRATSGRRTVDEIAALGWDTDPSPWLPAFTWGPFAPPAESLGEG
jgi:uncharacterized protein (TIGR03083 family)